MINMAPAEVIDIALKKFAFPLLKVKQFDRKGMHLWRRNKNTIDCIHLQKSQLNNKDHARFTMDLGVYWIDVERIRGKPYEALPEVPLATIRCRIEHLIPAELRRWWTAYPDTDPELFGHKVSEEIKLYGISWLIKGHDIRFVYNYLKGKNFTEKMEAVEKYILQTEEKDAN